MSDDRLPLAGSEPRAGCLRSAAAAVGLAGLAPLAAAVRAVRVWRRGSEVRLGRVRGSLGDGGRLATIDLTADVPTGSIERFRRLLTETVVRVAEVLRRPDDVYHVIHRDRAADETIVLPVGPQLQELGDRFHLALTQGAMTGRTVLWLTLPRGRRLVEIVDPFGYDPEQPGEPEGLLRTSDMRWAMVSAHAPRGPSSLVRLVLYVPRESATRVEAILDRLSP